MMQKTWLYRLPACALAGFLTTLPFMTLDTAMAGHHAESEKTGSHEADAKSAPAALNFTVKTIQEKDQYLGDYAGDVVLVVNVASKCGFTKQYEGLQTLYETYEAQGLKVLGFPANNYGGQEPGSNLEILQFCTGKYDVSFDMFAKVSAKGDDIAPFFAYLTENAPDDGKGQDIRWNFEKFLIDREGNVVQRFRSGVTPMSETMTDAVEAALKG